MRKKIVVLWVIGCLAVSSAKAQFNTVSNNVCRYKVRKVEEKFLLPANQPVDSIQANLLQQETDSVDSKQKQWISVYPSITYPLISIKITSLMAIVVTLLQVNYHGTTVWIFVRRTNLPMHDGWYCRKGWV